MESEPPAALVPSVHAGSHFIRFAWSETEQSVPARFEQQAARHPERIAVQDRGRRCTYRELDRAANRVARAVLAPLGPDEEPVALLFEPGVAAIEAVLGALKAGKIYLPLDPHSPPARLSFMLQDSGARLGLTDATNRALARELAPGVRWLAPEELAMDASDEAPRPALAPDRLASLYYTSGSTGRPKGVVETHRNRLVNAMRNTLSLQIGPEDRLSLLYHPAFSGSVNCLFGALLNGAALLPFDLKQEGVGRLANWLAAEAITVYHSPPPVFRQLVATLSGTEPFPDLRVVLLASDSLYGRDVELFRKHFPAECRLLNAWGATESPFFRPYVIDSVSPVPAGHVPAVGPACDEEEEILLLDEAGREITGDEVGEIVLCSRYLSPGYWRQPELTRARFQDDPAGGGRRRYRTGDLGRRMEDGSVVHLGRKDFQVKVRGYRVEVGEIEIALLGLDHVRDAVVLGKPLPGGDLRLVAYVVPDTGTAPTVTELRRALARTLPEYMVPSAFVLLDDLPRTPNGKVDRNQLPEPGQARPELDTSYLAPRTAVEAALAGIWSDVLEVEPVGVRDQFLELGGHSLQATQVLSRIRDMFHVELPLAVFFAGPTVAELAQALKEREPRPGGMEQVARLRGRVEAMSGADVRATLQRKRQRQREGADG